MCSRRPSSRLTLALLRWPGTVAAAVVAATVAVVTEDEVAVAVVVATGVSKNLSTCLNLCKEMGLTLKTGGANALPMGNRRW